MAGDGGRQLRLLLWKDYLTRKRMSVTLFGIIWASGIMFAMYMVRINVDNQDFPTCQFPARALPSAGMLPFLQSFICSVGNECSPLDKFEEIPAYENAKFTQIRRQISPILNESVLELASTMPDAVKLLATLSDVADEPSFRDFTVNGLKVRDLFKDPLRVKRYVTSHMRLSDDVSNSLMTSDVSLQGLLKGTMDRCSPESISQTLVVKDKEHLNMIVEKLCALTNEELQHIVMDLVMEIDFNKYIKMLGNMYYKLSGDESITRLGDFLTALLRMTKLHHFLPPELSSLFLGIKTDFSYLDLNMVPKFLDLFRPTFGETDEYNSLKEITDGSVVVVQYISKIFGSNDVADVSDMAVDSNNKEKGFDKINQIINNAMTAFREMNGKESNIDPYNVLTQLTTFVYKFLPKDKKHDVLFYSTLTAKLMESAHQVIKTNMHIEERAYNVTLRHPQAIKILKELPPNIIGKTFDALVSAERTQILTSKLNFPGQMFCDISKLQNFFLISKTVAESVKGLLCTDAWKNFVRDVVNSFGISDVKDSINHMASLLIKETMGKDTSSELYTIDQDFQILKNFTNDLVTMDAEKRPVLDWKKLLNIDEDSEFMKVVKEKAHLAKLILISVHGALAKEIVKQNVILQYKITPILLDANTIITAFNDPLETIPTDITEGIKKSYGNVVKTILLTALDEEKTYKSLSTYCEDMLCNGGENAATYLNFPEDANVDELASALCEASVQIEKGMQSNSAIAKAINKIKNTTHTSLEEVNWTKLINSIQKLYQKLDKDYPYLFEYSTYSMDNTTEEELLVLFKNAKSFWFSIMNLQRALHLSLKAGFRLLDIIDHGMFNITSEIWLKIKYSISLIIGPFGVLDDVIQLVTALLTNTTYTSNLPQITVDSLSKVLPNLPQLIVDFANIIVKDDTDIKPIISLMNSQPAWPCSTTSLSSLLELSSSSAIAVQGLETIMCMDKDLQEEWALYIDGKKAKINRTLTYNTTEYDPHLFLKFSAVTDSLINDTILIKDTLQYVLNDDPAHISLKTALDYAIEVINTTERNEILRKFLHKVDTVVNSITTSTILENKSMNAMWDSYLSCSSKTTFDDECKDAGRSAWKYTLKMMSVILDNIAIDLTTYFTEVHEPDSNVLQMLGFTRNTTLYMLYDRLPEFISVLLNSYWDFGFMSQVRRAAQSQFWDCEGVVTSMVPPPGSSIQMSHINRIKSYVCPSFIYWLSMPRDDNVLFNLVAKPQYFFYSMPVVNATSTFENAFMKAATLTQYLDETALKETEKIKNELKVDNLEHKLGNVVDKILNYKLTVTNPLYLQFSDIYRKHFISNIYLTKIVTIVNKLATAINNITIEENGETNAEEVKKLNADLKTIKNIFKRKSSEAIEILYDVLTDVFWKNDNYTLIDAMDFACNNINDKNKTILVDEDRIKAQLCAKNYKFVFGEVQDILMEDYDDARESLLNVVEALKTPDVEVLDIFDFFSSKEEYILSLKTSIKYSYELGLPVYLKYLQSNLQSYNIILNFISGGDWWKEVRDLYNGPYSEKFFGFMESGFEIADDFLNNLDGVHLIRLAHDLNLTDSDSFCRPNITLSDYLPDRTHILSELKIQICSTQQEILFKEIPPLMYASQGYESSLTVSKDVDYESIRSDIIRTRNNLDLLAPGPKDPQLPSWITQEKIKGFRDNVMNLLSKETITKVVFGIMSNGVDAGTLFLKTNYCAVCSQMTSWFKQLNLQLFKKQEYDALLCRMDDMTLEEVYHSLKNDFHWDMFISEIISTRNYTKYELNKSMNEFLSLVKTHLLEDMMATQTKLSTCLVRNVEKNELGNAALVIKVLSHTAKLLQAYSPHIHEVAGITDLPYLKDLYTKVAHNLDVYTPLKNYVNVKELQGVVKDEMVLDVEGSDVNLKMVHTATKIEELLKLKTNKWEHICMENDCNAIFNVIVKQLNFTRIDGELPALQSTSYWQLTFISSILQHIQSTLSHIQSTVGAVSSLDLRGAASLEVQATVDLLVAVLADDTFSVLINGLQGLIEEFHPLLQDTILEGDMDAIAAGLKIFYHLKTYLVEEENLKLQVSKLFPNPEPVESGLTSLGINNTNFWSIAAPRIHAGFINIKPILSPKTSVHISNYVCQLETMSSVIIPGSLDVVTAEDVFAATADQFCGLQDTRVKEMLPVLVGNFDLNVVVEKVKTHLLTKLYSASHLTAEEGDQVISRLPRLAGLLPMLQDNIGEVMDSLSEEPLFQDLKDFSSVGNLMSSSDFLSHAGVMVCGKPFQTPSSRIIKNIISTKDLTQEVDQAQLDVLPTDFCRSMYKEVISMEGGKIVWSFVKPLIMGRILYTPLHPTVQRIIDRVNSTFSGMVQMANLVHSFASAFPSIQSISSHKLGVDALQHLITNPGFGDLRKMLLGGEKIDFNVDVDGLVEKLGDIEGIGSLLSKASNLLRCVNLDRLRGLKDEQELMVEAGRLMTVNEFAAGIVFMNVDQLDDSMTNVEYKIRMDIENAPTTKWMKPYLWTPGPESSFIENMRYFRGLIQIQDLVDKAVIQIAGTSSNRTKREVREEDWAVYTQQEPYPCYRKDFFQSSLYESQSLLVCIFFALLFTVASAVRFIVADKETGNTMLMSVMGVNLSYHTLSWLISSLVEMSITMVIVSIILKWGSVLPKTDPTLVFVIFMVFAVSVLSFCYLMSKLFKSASFAAVCAGLAYLTTFMPFVLILSLEAVMNSSLKLFVCLSMSSSVMYAFLYVTRYEAMGIGASWAQLWDSPNDDDMCIAYAMGMMCVDAVIYMIIGYVIDWYFGIKSIGSSVTHVTTGEQKAGVSIVNVSKIYSGSNKLALDNVSMDLHKGQITALLGHNGAGKTTLTNIITGMLKPTSGSITIRSDGGTRLGVCPQKDVLFEYMTAREHIALYAQLMNGLDKEEVGHEVERMLRVLSLGPVSELPAASLSGGTRRRLCVALAFVARPTLVSLDEPTSGVDPSARRDIWSMIVKLKEDRTILLTTHHLDEAELLSDQIVIMHKGQIHTSGTPIDIKRSLGSGYKLSITLPDRKDEWYSIEEKTKQIMGVVRDVVKNASVEDVHGTQVEIGLPFYEAEGGSNNFVQVCKVLEQQQATLGFKNFSMDCSSLEQVFFEICQRADIQDNKHIVEEHPSKSASTSSIKSEQSLVSSEGVRRGTRSQQFIALMRARFIHHFRNRWLLFMLIVLPSLFITLAMAFSTLRPPADNEIALKLSAELYPNSTQYLVPYPSIHSDSIDPMFAQQIMSQLKMDMKYRDWMEKDTPKCKCVVTRQECESDKNVTKPDLMLLPDAATLNSWLVNSQETYLEDRYGGFTSTISNNKTNLISWYNNKGFHAMPSYLNVLNNAILRSVAGTNKRITVYSHPMKISKEQISKNTVYQHIADAGISALVFMSYSLISAGSAIYLVSTRKRQEKRLQLLCGVTPSLYWSVAMTWDMMIILVNMLITAALMWSFGFPVFVARNNLPAICILIVLYGFACGSLVHLLEKIFSEASLANMMIFCGNTFIGLSGIVLLLILDLISESDKTDNARWILHKLLMLSPQFALGDGLIEIAKNTIQAQVLNRFGMDTYRDPLSTSLLVLQYSYLVMVGVILVGINLAVEYGYLQCIVYRCVPSKVYISTGERITPEPEDVAEERKNVVNMVSHNDNTLSVSTIGNINRGFVNTEGKNNSVSRAVRSVGAAHVVSVGKAYGTRVAVRALTLNVPHSQCVALLGENGAGKSTTFAMLTGETIPTRGEIYLDGKLRDARGLCRGLISYCPQSDAIDPLLTVRETLDLYCRLRGITDIERVIFNAVETFELTRYKDVCTQALSGGNKRKLCAAIALASRAPLVLLDEPTSGMDPWSRACVWRGVRAARVTSRGVLLSTHALDDARRLADTVALMREGELAAIAPLHSCLTRFGGGYVVSCRSNNPRSAWRRVSTDAPQARLRVMHDHIIHFLMPTRVAVEKKEITTHLSDIFRLMSELQASGVIEDYTVNQSSLDQMFLSFAEKADISLHSGINSNLCEDDNLDTITAL